MVVAGQRKRGRRKGKSMEGNGKERKGAKG